MLTTVLFTSVFSIGGNLITSFQYSTMLQSGGSAHGTFKDLTQEQFGRLKQAAPAGTILDRNIICAYEVENPGVFKASSGAVVSAAGCLRAPVLPADRWSCTPGSG